MKKIVLLSATLLLAACGGDELSQSKAEKAINLAAKESAVCVPFNLDVEHSHEGDMTQLGAPDILLLKRLDNGKRANSIATEQMKIIVDAGLYREEKVVHVGEGDHTIRFLAYSITDKGRNSFVPTPHGNLLCIGHESVEKINYFTTPTPANGLTVSQVSYESKIIPEGWAKKLLKNTPQLVNLQTTQTKVITLVKTSEGWRDINELRPNATRKYHKH